MDLASVWAVEKALKLDSDMMLVPVLQTSTYKFLKLFPELVEFDVLEFFRVILLEGVFNGIDF